MSFRQEKKFRLTQSDFNTLKNNLRLQGMEPLYSSRKINSLYYDTEDHNMFFDSEEALLPRKKVRIRWYEDVKEASLEVKTSSIEGRFKTSDRAQSTEKTLLPESLYDTQYGSVIPSLLVCYSREYFTFKSMRITFDSDIKYVNKRLSQNVTFVDGECVMEIKVGIDVDEDYIERFIPYSTSRFSKYCRGLLLTSKEQ